MSRKNSTNTSRAARRLAKITDLTYAQALARLRSAGTVPDLDDRAAVEAFLAATTKTEPTEPTAGSAAAGLDTARVAQLQTEARRLDFDVEMLLHEWDAHDEVDTTLGVAVAEVGGRVAGLLQTVAPLLTTDADRSDAADQVRELEAACDYYDELDEHDTNASIDIVDRIGPALAEALRALGVADTACVNCGFPVERDPGTGTGWTHVESSLKTGGWWCNPEFTRDHAHTTAEPGEPDIGVRDLREYTHPDGVPLDPETNPYREHVPARPGPAGPAQLVVHHACAPDCGSFVNGDAAECTCGGAEVIAPAPFAGSADRGPDTCLICAGPVDEDGFCAQDCTEPAGDTDATAGDGGSAPDLGAALNARMSDLAEAIRSLRTDTVPSAGSVTAGGEDGYECSCGHTYDTVAELDAHVCADDPAAESAQPGPVCHFCRRRAGADYHLAGVIAAEDNHVVCDDCWDERLR